MVITTTQDHKKKQIESDALEKEANALVEEANKIDEQFTWFKKAYYVFALACECMQIYDCVKAYESLKHSRRSLYEALDSLKKLKKVKKLPFFSKFFEIPAVSEGYLYAAHILIAAHVGVGKNSILSDSDDS
jgi:hypothetical protein